MRILRSAPLRGHTSLRAAGCPIGSAALSCHQGETRCPRCVHDLGACVDLRRSYSEKLRLHEVRQLFEVLAAYPVDVAQPIRSHTFGLSQLSSA